MFAKLSQKRAKMRKTTRGDPWGHEKPGKPDAEKLGFLNRNFPILTDFGPDFGVPRGEKRGFDGLMPKSW